MKIEALVALFMTLGCVARAQEGGEKHIVSEPPDSRFRSFDKAMLEFMEKRSIPGGALAVVKDGRLVYAQGYGYADRERKEKARATSLFRIASVSKPITSLALLHLVQEKSAKISLDARAFLLLDAQPFLDPGKDVDPRLRKITVLNLLQHTAGWDRDKSGDPMFDPVNIALKVGTPAPASPDAIIRYMAGRPLDFEPGAKEAYSNFGYCVLGRIIEQVSGKSYERYVKEEILAPMGITRMRLGKSLRSGRARDEATYYQPNLGMAQSVFPQGDKEVPWCYGGFHLEAMDSHGGWLASAVDLARFCAKLESPDPALLNSEMVQALYARPKPPVGLDADGTPKTAYYACGWMVRPVGNRANYWHTGSLPGTFSLLVQRNDGISWAVLFNQRSEGDAPSDNEIDPALHIAANAVKDWGSHDLFSRYFR